VAGALAALLERAARGSAPGVPLRIEASPEGEGVHFRVDGGAPPTDEERALVEGPFWSTRIRRQDPRVPDLALARAVIHAHRGRIWFDGDGGAIHVTMPTSPVTAR
jgi:K+-sensing histidine kinase KdpD